MEELDSIIEKTEMDFLNRLVVLLRDGSLSLEDGKNVTRQFLAMTPFTSTEDLQTKVKQFTTTHRDFGGVLINLLNYHEENKTQDLLKRMREHIKDNKIDEALQLISK